MTFHAKRRRRRAKGSRGVENRTRTPRLTLHLPMLTMKQLRTMAGLRHVPVSALVRDAIAEWVVREAKRNPFMSEAA